jgi:hypothetical protein
MLICPPFGVLVVRPGASSAMKNGVRPIGSALTRFAV